MHYPLYFHVHHTLYRQSRSPFTLGDTSNPPNFTLITRLVYVLRFVLYFLYLPMCIYQVFIHILILRLIVVTLQSILCLSRFREFAQY